MFNKIKVIFIIITMLFSFNSNADDKPVKHVKDMLEQIYSINASWRPVIWNAVEPYPKSNMIVVIIKLYDINKIEADPEKIDVQAGFVCRSSKTGAPNKCALKFIVFSSNDLIEYIDKLIN